MSKVLQLVLSFPCKLYAHFSTVVKTLQQSVVSAVDSVWCDCFDLDLKR